LFDFCFNFEQNEDVNKTRGFTLIELLLVMALIMILSAVGIGSYIQATVKSKDTQRKSDINQMVKAVESFNNDVGRYPLSDSENNILCVTKVNSIITNPISSCDGKIKTVNDGVPSIYMAIPKDPVTLLNYPYVSAGTDFVFYAALENSNDKDLLIDAEGNIVTYPGFNCGSTPCNYKVTESGVVKSL
jgi:general secretion pathway protein G